MTVPPRAPIPAHVPDDRVIPFDIFADPRYGDDPQLAFARLQKEAPSVFWTPFNGGHWVVLGKQAVEHVIRTYRDFTSTEMMIPKTGELIAMPPLSYDPPEHVPLRQVLMQIFSAKVVAALEDHIRGWANRLIDRVIDKGECDFLPAVAESLPVSVFMQLAGLPLDRLQEFRSWVDIYFGSGSVEERHAVAGTIMNFMMSVVAERRKKREDDIISHLLDIELDGRPLDDDTIRGLCLLLFVAGLDTVVNAMCFAMKHFAQDPALQERIAADPSLIPTMVEEVLRRYGFTGTNRCVKQDTDFGGVHFKKGDMVYASLCSAGTDEHVHQDPLRFDIDRPNKEHMTFGSGPHQCVGRHLARFEMRVTFEEIVRRMKNIRLKPGAVIHTRGGSVFAMDTLPIRFERRIP